MVARRRGGQVSVGQAVWRAIQVRFFFYRSESSPIIIETHFAEMFRPLPEPVPYVDSRKEKWISSSASALVEGPELITTPRDSKTPERQRQNVATVLSSFVLS